MIRGVRSALQCVVAASTSCWLFVAAEQLAAGQMVRPPDVGVWFKQERSPDGINGLVVSDVLADGIFAQAGLREGDRVVSANGKPVDRDQQFVQAFLTNPMVTLVIARGAQQQTLTLKSSAVLDAMVPLDPYYQTGFLVDEQDQDRTTVQRVFPATLAFYADLKPGDVIASLNDRPLAGPTELTKALRRGGRLNLIVMRNDQSRQLTLILTTPSIRLRGAPTAGPLSPGGAPLPSAPSYGLPATSLLASPSLPNPTPAMPSPPPAIPALPPPGAVPSGT
jgi:S1-C subfamily serine protease